MKLRLTLFFVCLSAFLFTISGSALAEEKTTSGGAVDISAVSAVLIEGSTGDIIYEKDKDKELVPASITKIMTLTLIFEALDNGKLTLETPVSVSEYAATMGGSQVFLEPNETQTVDTMIKCISIASANDAAVAMAEKIAGSEEAFVKKMNEKAVALGMKHTQFKNCTGLDDNIDPGHFSFVDDVAIVSRELITIPPEISNYFPVWINTIFGTSAKGETEFGLTNTNKLVRFYDGITGLKTGSTSKAKYCLSASARRDDMDLIAVIMAAPDHKKRFSEAQALLDYGFANCHIYRDTDIAQALKPVPVQGGKEDQVVPVPKSTFSYLLKNEDSSAAPTRKISYFDAQKAPLKKGAPVGSVDYYEKDKKIGSVVLAASKDIPAAGFTDYLLALTKKLFHKS